MAHDVFISYATEDQRIVNSLVHFLEADGVRCWYAPRDVLPGANYGAQIADAIRSTRILILVLSSHSNQSLPVSNEVERAMHNGVVVLPIRIEDVFPSPNLELHIAGAHWLDALTEPLELHQEAVVRAVHKHLEAIGGEPARPPSSSRAHAQPRPRSAGVVSEQLKRTAPRTHRGHRGKVAAAIVGVVIVGAAASAWFLTRPGLQGNTVAAGSPEDQDSGDPVVNPMSGPPSGTPASLAKDSPSDEELSPEPTPPEPEVAAAINDPLPASDQQDTGQAEHSLDDSSKNVLSGEANPDIPDPPVQADGPTTGVTDWMLVPDVRVSGSVGMEAGDLEDEWNFTAPGNGYVLFECINEHPRGTRQGDIQAIVLTSKGVELWDPDLKPDDPERSGTFAVNAGQVLRIQVMAKEGHAAPYNIRPTFTPLGNDCPPDDAPGVLEAGVTTRGCVGFEAGDNEDEWSFTAPANGYVFFECVNEHPRRTLQGEIEATVLTSKGVELWDPDLKPDDPERSGTFAVNAGQVLRIQVKAKEGHAAPYRIRPSFTPLGTDCPPDVAPGTLEPGVLVRGCVGFEAGDDEDEWNFISPADSDVYFVCVNQHPRGTDLGDIQEIEVMLNGAPPWRRRLRPGDDIRSSTFAVSAGQVVRVRVRVHDGHAALYSIRQSYTQ
ncbi:MAG: toll/interleukin-1 receptor domain-containing protein [Phycisphaerales bacterium]